MRLSDVLSKEIIGEYKQVENFMGSKKCPCGKSKKLEIGKLFKVENGRLKSLLSEPTVFITGIIITIR